MAEDVEIPEAKDSFEKRIAISIAIIAVMLSYISMKGDNAKTDAIIKTNEAANKWGHFQSKSIKQHEDERAIDIIKGQSTTPETAQRLEVIAASMKKYDGEKEELFKEATKLNAEADESSKINDRCDFAALFLQISVVICSVAILSRLHLFWFAGLALAAVGAFKFFF